MVRRTIRQIEDTVKAPFRSMKETLARIQKTLQDVINKTKNFFDRIKRIILGICKGVDRRECVPCRFSDNQSNILPVHVIKKAVSWLGSVVSICNKKLGTPFQRCMKTFDDAIEDCKVRATLQQLRLPWLRKKQEEIPCFRPKWE